MPKISVIMGLYNTPKEYIKISIDSILSQTFTDFEFIICNDGCTDGSFEFIKQNFSDARLVLIENQKNMGLTYSLNHCLSVAKGEYICRMDSDDCSHTERLSRQNDFLDKNIDFDLVTSNVNYFDDNGIYKIKKFPEIITKKDFLWNSPIIHPAIMVRKKALDKVDGYLDVPYTVRNEDYDLFMRMYASNIKMYTIQDVLFDYREDKNSLKKRKYKYRINEFKVRMYNFKLLKIPFLKRFVFEFKPLIVGLVPGNLLNCIKRVKK